MTLKFALACSSLCLVIAIASLAGSLRNVKVIQDNISGNDTCDNITNVFHTYVVPSISVERERDVFAIRATNHGDLSFIIVEYRLESISDFTEVGDGWFRDLGPGVASMVDAVAFAKVLVPLNHHWVLWMRPPADTNEIDAMTQRVKSRRFTGFSGDEPHLTIY